MFKFKAMSVAAVAAGVLAVGATALPASASTAGALVFSGNTTTLTPVLLVGGSGSYSFSSSTPSPQGVPGACVGAGANTAAQVGAGLCTVTSSGTYNNIVCGTGTTGTAPLGFSDTSTINNFTVGTGLTVSFKYEIVFVAGVGVILSLTPDAPVPDVGGGVVNILPTGGSCLTGVTNFTATGVSAVV